MALASASAPAPAGASTEIVWDEPRSRFRTPDGKAYLEYQSKGGGHSLDLVHTYVPPSMRGRGLAARLCHAAFSHAKEHRLRVIPTCSYISDTFLPRNPSWKDLIAQHDHDTKPNENEIV